MPTIQPILEDDLGKELQKKVTTQAMSKKQAKQRLNQVPTSCSRSVVTDRHIQIFLN
jgi:hypothetical protein